MIEYFRAIVSIIIREPFFTLDNIIKLEQVDKLYEVSGKYDAIAILRLPIDELNDTLDKIKHIKGVDATSTIIVLNEILEEHFTK